MSTIQCPRCHNEHLQKRGIRSNSRRYQCRNCGYFFSKPAEFMSRVPKVLLFDIETLPMKAFIWELYQPVLSYKNIIDVGCTLSYAAKWLFDDKMMGEILTPKEAKERNDERIVRNLWKLLDEADVVIGHNSDKFDIRKMNTRFLYYRMSPPSPYVTIDTKKAAKNMFYLPSNSQGFITEFLELQEKLHTDFDLWLRCYEGDKSGLEEMMTYNKRDVAGLEEMYVTLRPWIPKHPNMSVFMTTEGTHCPKCMSNTLSFGGIYPTPANLYRAFRCNNCGTVGRTSSSVLTSQKRKDMVRVS